MSVVAQPSDATFRALLEAAPDAIVGVGSDGCIVIVNAQAEVLFGYDRAELLGMPVEVLVPEAVRGIHVGHRSGYFAQPVTRPMGAGMELAGRRKDGTEFPAEISLSAIETPDGPLVSAAVRDGTERKQAAIVNSSNDAIVSVDLDRTVTSWNPGAERLYGYPAREVVGRSADVLVAPEGLDEELARFRTVCAGDRVAPFESTHVRTDGSPIDITCTMSAITDASGAIVGISTIASDITERKQAEIQHQALQDRLNQSQRLESLGQLAGGVAHDFNNLIAVILNNASFVAEEVADNATALRDVEEIRTAAERAARLTRRLLIFGRRETVQPEVLDLNAIVADVQILLSRTIGEHIELSVVLGAELPAIRIDRGQLEQVLLNLAVNARDAMPDGGHLTIETEVTELDEEYSRAQPPLARGRYVVLTVSDTGTGMEPEVIERAFEPFFTTKPKGEGTGLGLATIYGVVSEAGGAISLYSEAGLGTTVRVYLPPVDEEARQLPEPQAVAGGTGETILVVEDEAPMRRVALRILRRNGYAVLEAASVDEALTVLDDHTCDLVLTDVVMPQRSGRELAHELQARGLAIPVLFMSGYSQGVLGPQRQLDEGVALIQKPFDERQLVEAVRSLMEADRA